MPTACVKPGELLPALLASLSNTVARALQRGVVQQKYRAVGAQFGVAFKHAVAVACTGRKRRQRVFRRELASTTVSNPARVGPLWRLLVWRWR